MAKGTASRDMVVGVFLDEDFAQRAIQALQSAGFKARIADESAIKAFRESGLEDEVVQIYQSRYAEGNSIVTVDAGNRGDDALGIMLQNGAEYINLSGEGSSQGQGQGADYYARLDRGQRQYGQYDANLGRASTAEELRVRLHEETLGATKTAQQAGEVEVRKVVHEREQQIPVNLRHEEVYVERRAVNEAANPEEIRDMQDEVIRVPVYEEQAQLHKQARVAEEVVIGKQAVEEQQTLSGTVRKEELVVEETGDVEMRGAGQTQTRTETHTHTHTDTDRTRK